MSLYDDLPPPSSSDSKNPTKLNTDISNTKNTPNVQKENGMKFFVVKLGDNYVDTQSAKYLETLMQRKAAMSKTQSQAPKPKPLPPKSTTINQVFLETLR